MTMCKKHNMMLSEIAGARGKQLIMTSTVTIDDAS